MYKAGFLPDGVKAALQRCLNRTGSFAGDAQGGKMMEKWKESPCTHCSRVTNWARCDNKDCALWRKWFLNRWQQLRKLYLKGGEA